MELAQLDNLPPWEWPEDADKTLLAVLGDKSAEESDRILAADLAGDYTVMGNDVALALLGVACSEDASAALRGEAAVSLGTALEHADIIGFDDPDDLLITRNVFGEIQKTLRDLYENTSLPRDLRRRVLEASVHAPQAWHDAAVREAYADPDEYWRLTAVFCMHYVRGFEKEVVASLEDQNPDIHYWAVCAAGNWGLPEAWPHVVALISAGQTTKPLLIAAIHATAAIRPEAAGDILSELLDHEDEEIVDAVMEALSMAEALEELENDEQASQDD